MNILIVAPHPDDEAIGCGGAVCLHADKGDRVSAAFLTSGELGLQSHPVAEAQQIREKEAAAAAEILGIGHLEFLRQRDYHLSELIDRTATLLSACMKTEPPEWIYLPHPGEWHPDHQASLPIVRLAAALADIRPRLLLYEVWTPLTHHDDGQDITAVMHRKLRAIRAHRSQVAQFGYDRAIRGLNQYRGALAWRCRYAEVFQEGTLDEAL